MQLANFSKPMAVLYGANDEIIDGMGHLFSIIVCFTARLNPFLGVSITQNRARCPYYGSQLSLHYPMI
jgi:hypothetical protein